MYLDIKCSSWLAPEAPDLLDEPHGCLADQDPHSLTLLLNLPRHQSRLRHHAVVGNFRPGDNSDCWATSIVCWLKKGPHPSYFTCENPFWYLAWRSVCEESERPQTQPGDPEPCWQSLSRGCLLKIKTDSSTQERTIANHNFLSYRHYLASLTPPWSHPPSWGRCRR